MEDDPIQNDARKQKRERRIGPNALCARCGEQDYVTLVDPDKVDRRLLEEHHVASRRTDQSFTVTLCRNCHAQVEEGLRDAGLDRDTPETILHRIKNVLISLGAFLKEAGEWLLELAEELARFIGALDENHPDWQQQWAT